MDRRNLLIAALAAAVVVLGALLAIEREIEIGEFVEAGTVTDAELTRDLLIAIFLPYSPLHDGAVIIRGGRIATAGCILPLSLRSGIPSTLGTRHRAAVGITEETDALVIVVSEETGRIALVVGGDVHGVVGATLSARATARGVRRVLAYYQVLIEGGQP